MLKERPKYLLVVEDDPGLQSQLRWSFEGYEVLIAGDRETALTHLRRHEPSVVTLDLGLPPDPSNASEGLALLEEILKLAPQTKIIVVTGNDDRENAIKAIGLGAYDFYQKPIEPEMLALIIERAYNLYLLEQEHQKLLRKNEQSPIEGIIGGSAEMLKVCRIVEKVAPTDVTTLILGESGTGKELIARALHNLSPRANEKFLAINCAAIPETLLESELFGYEKGAFTGANKQTLGKIEYAHKGTFFLDEVGDLPMALQAKMLRFLQERVIERVGGREEIPVDVRIVCATHQDLSHLIEEGTFREDLYYRISEISINLPPLRARGDDVLMLAKVFLDRYNKQNKRKIRGFSDNALAAITHYSWPGNIRELENKIKRAAIMAEGSQITAEELELDEKGESLLVNLRQIRDEAERTAISRALIICNDSISKAAEILGVSRPTLYDLMNKHGLK
ncbi:MAG: PEP-CTERM-box response regulator transcription factor [Gammaproteobacteria bacterium]|jgi:two-component system NtrC family response regulator